MTDGTRNFARSEQAGHFPKKYSLAPTKSISSSSPSAATSAKSLSKYKSLIPGSFMSPQHCTLKTLSGTSISTAATAETNKGARLLSPKAFPKTIEKLPDLGTKRNDAGKPPGICSMNTISVAPNLPRIDPPKISTKKVGIIKAYAATTHQGIVRYCVLFLFRFKNPTSKTGIIMRTECQSS